MADCWGASDNTALGAEIVMLPIDNFFRAAALWPDRIAVEIADADRCRQTSYAALAEMTRAMAAGLQAIDPQPQSRVGICAYNNFEHFLAWLGCFAAGKVLRRAAKELFA